MTNYTIAVDGGGTRCRAKLYDEQGLELGSGVSGSANVRLGAEQVQASVLKACKIALDDAQVPGLSLNACSAGLGLAGFARDHGKRQLIVDCLSPHFAHSTFNSDVYIACLGAHGLDNGTCLVLGTGSCGLVMDNAVFSIMGGWGMMAGDHGSGAAAGVLALRRTVLAYDGFIAQSDFTHAIAKRLNSEKQNPLAWVTQAKPADYAKLAPLVFEYAARHDAEAQLIVNQLLADVQCMVDTLYAKGLGAVALMGGLADIYLELLAKTHGEKICRAKSDALRGAYLMVQNL